MTREHENCPFETYVKEINESRCVIPLDLPKKVLGERSLESWLCMFRNLYEECPILKRLGMKMRDMIMPTFCTFCGHDTLELKVLKNEPAPIGDAYAWRITCTHCKAEFELEEKKTYDMRMEKILK